MVKGQGCQTKQEYNTYSVDRKGCEGTNVAETKEKKKKEIKTKVSHNKCVLP